MKRKSNYISSYQIHQSRRARLKHPVRFYAALLLLFLSVYGLITILSKNSDATEPAMGTIALTPEPTISLTPVLTPTDSPTHTPTPTVIPTPVPSPTNTPTLAPSPTKAPTPSPTQLPSPTAKPQTGVSRLKDVLVCIDPGHGGKYPGTVSPYRDEYYEKDIVLDISLRLRELLKKEGIKVLMTRETDAHLKSDWKEDIWERPKIANEQDATFYVSIHVNALDLSIKGAAACNGTEIYHYGKTHGDFTSKQFAEMMGEAIHKVAGTKYNGVIQEDFGVLRLSNMPALLVETAFITNKEDHKRLESDEFRQNMARGIFNGTMEILETMGAYQENGKYKIKVYE